MRKPRYHAPSDDERPERGSGAHNGGAEDEERGARLDSALAAGALAAPLEPRAMGPTDAQILNYALTLEHLENTFYRQALAKFTPQDFVNAGVEPTFYGNLKEIASDEKTHVSFLTTALQCM